MFTWEIKQHNRMNSSNIGLGLNQKRTEILGECVIERKREKRKETKKKPACKVSFCSVCKWTYLVQDGEFI